MMGDDLVVINEGWSKFMVQPGTDDLSLNTIHKVTEKAWGLWEKSSLVGIDSKKGALEFMSKVREEV